MPGNEIGVEVCQDYVLDLERVLGRKRYVLVRISLRINHGSRACSFVPNNVGRMREARQIELLKDHAAPFPECSFC
jgi:hypothetical protein